MKKIAKQILRMVLGAYDAAWRLLERRNVVMTVVLYLMISQPAWAASANFSTGIGKVLGVATWVAYAGCAFFMYELIMHWRNGGNFGRDIIGVLLCAGAGTICALIFGAFGLSSAVVDPTF